MSDEIVTNYGVLRQRRTRSAVVLAVSVMGCLVIAGLILPPVRGDDKPAGRDVTFPAEMVRFHPYAGNPVFTAAPGEWDTKIRERGWILRDGDVYRLWYTGYDGAKESRKLLGLATSTDGIHWIRSPHNPLLADLWVEDMMVVRQGDLYYMFAEGERDQAQLLTSSDGIHWSRRGTLRILKSNGEPIPPGPFGTPTAYFEDGTWWLFYERGDQGVWLAKSTDLDEFTNVQDEPVLARGPGSYDAHAVAMNQIVRRGDQYFAYYHASDSRDWKEWSTCVAVSNDLIHWTKFPGNPIVKNNKSSGILVPTPTTSDDASSPGRFWLYTMHNQVDLYEPAEESDKPAVK